MQQVGMVANAYKHMTKPNIFLTKLIKVTSKTK